MKAGCKISDSIVESWQEREQTVSNKLAVQHEVLNSYILNTHFTHSFGLLRHLYPPIGEAPSMEEVAKFAAEAGQQRAARLKAIKEKKESKIAAAVKVREAERKANRLTRKKQVTATQEGSEDSEHFEESDLECSSLEEGSDSEDNDESEGAGSGDDYEDDEGREERD